MKFVILCPYQSRTGGPEALMQLSDALITHGFDATVWLCADDDISAIMSGVVNSPNGFAVSPKTQDIPEYSRYKVKAFTGRAPGEAICYVLPESYISLISVIIPQRVILWWLSVDFALSELSRINLNFLRQASITHATQSHYAKEFCESLGLRTRYLSDYTIVDDRIVEDIDCRHNILALNAGTKVIYNLDYIEGRLKELISDVEVVRLQGMSRVEVYELFSRSRLFIDLGNFPGKDRMVREAVMLGTNAIICNSGAGASKVDFALDDIYRADPSDINSALTLAAHMIRNPLSHSENFTLIRSQVLQERLNFEKEVLCLFSKVSMN